MEYYYTDNNNQTIGPVSLDRLHSLCSSGALNASAMIAPVGSQQWSPIGTLIPTVAPAAPVAAPPATPIEPLALSSFITSLAGFVCCPIILPSIAGAVLGHLALSKFKKNPRLVGKGFAVAGLIIGYVGVAVQILYFVLNGFVALVAILSER